MKERLKKNIQIGAKNTEETTVSSGNRKEAGTVIHTLRKIQKGN